MKLYLKNIALLSSLFAIVYLIPISIMHAQTKTNPASQSEELGNVSWYRDFTQATSLAKTEDKAVLLLFQEVPGCMTCRNYGHNVLSHPLMVEAIENLFVPLAIYNNKGGKDKQVLEMYNEPTWNNPVVRIVDNEGENLVKRVAGEYSAIALYEAMVTALNKQGKPLPEFMKILGTELTAIQRGTEQEAYFQMYCFWSGEKHLGDAQGVLSTEAGFMDGHEVVKVKYDPMEISKNELNGYAKQANCTPIAESNTYRTSPKDQHYYLRHSDYQYLPLSELQKSKINSALGKNQPAALFLSPRQQLWLKEIGKSKMKMEPLFNLSFVKAWELKSKG